MQHFLALILTPFFLFCTAVPPDSVPPDYLVNEITVTCPQHFSAPLQFTDQETMGRILEYLRSVPLHGPADRDSMEDPLPLYSIRLTHTTGRITEYRQLGSDYLSKDSSPWYHIDPEDGQVLEDLFRRD